MNERLENNDVFSDTDLVIQETRSDLGSLEKAIITSPNSENPMQTTLPAWEIHALETENKPSEAQTLVLDGLDALLEDEPTDRLHDAILNDVLWAMKIDDTLRGKSLGNILSEIVGSIDSSKKKSIESKQAALIGIVARNKLDTLDLTQSFDTLPAKQKVKLMALYHAFSSKPPVFSSGGVGESLKWVILSGKQSTRESRYSFWMSHVVDRVNTTFKGMQKGGIADYLRSLSAKNPGLNLDDTIIDEYIQQLEALKQHLDRIKPQEGNVYGYAFFLLVGIGIWLFAKHKYDQFMLPQIQRGLPIGEIQLMDPQVLSLITTAQQPFLQTGARTDKQFDSSDDTGILKIWKDIVNVFQSRTIEMNMQGNVEVSFDFNDYSMSFDGKRLHVVLNSPTYRVADAETYILNRNSEWVETATLNQTEQELWNQLKNKVIDKAIESRAVEHLAKQQLSTLLYNLYTVIDPKLEGVDVTIKGDPSRS
jgi:hypothetical protein